MIITTTAYGISVTDDFGYAKEGSEDLLAAVQDLEEDLYSHRPWMVTLPSAEDQQVVIGITANITKTTDFAQLHQRWKDAVAQAPDAIKALIQDQDPDVWFLAGHC